MNVHTAKFLVMGPGVSQEKKKKKKKKKGRGAGTLNPSWGVCLFNSSAGRREGEKKKKKGGKRKKKGSIKKLVSWRDNGGPFVFSQNPCCPRK